MGQAFTCREAAVVTAGAGAQGLRMVYRAYSFPRSNIAFRRDVARIAQAGAGDVADRFTGAVAAVVAVVATV